MISVCVFCSKFAKSGGETHDVTKNTYDIISSTFIYCKLITSRLRKHSYLNQDCFQLLVELCVEDVFVVRELRLHVIARR